MSALRGLLSTVLFRCIITGRRGSGGRLTGVPRRVWWRSTKNASEITADSAGDITTIIQQQAIASEQILITLKQIASGVDKFRGATESVSEASQKLQVIAEELRK